MEAVIGIVIMCGIFVVLPLVLLRMFVRWVVDKRMSSHFAVMRVADVTLNHALLNPQPAVYVPVSSAELGAIKMQVGGVVFGVKPSRRELYLHQSHIVSSNRHVINYGFRPDLESIGDQVLGWMTREFNDHLVTHSKPIGAPAE